MDKRWVIKKPGDAVEVTALMEALDVDQTVANLLVQRGLKNYEEAQEIHKNSLVKIEYKRLKNRVNEF